MHILVLIIMQDISIGCILKVVIEYYTLNYGFVTPIHQTQCNLIIPHPLLPNILTIILESHNIQELLCFIPINATWYLLYYIFILISITGAIWIVIVHPSPIYSMIIVQCNCCLECHYHLDMLINVNTRLSCHFK